jgi:hypothetical protein
MYSWAAAKLFVETIKKVGPNLTRQAFLDQLKKVTAYDANGLVPPQNVATQQPTDCIIMLDIQGGAFVREAPASGYRCRPAPGPV